MRRFLAPIVIGLAGIAILVWLGSWQIQRLGWKQGILAEITSTISGPAKALPIKGAATPDLHRYQPVEISGRIGAEEVHVLVSVKHRGAGYRIIADFTMDDGRRVLLDRGYVPTAQRATERRTGPATVRGNLHWPDDRNSSTPANDVVDNIWYARDIPQMADALGTEPLLVIARSETPADPGLTPLPVDTSGIPNDHLQYAITWFSLAAVWLLMTGVWIRRLAQDKEP